MKSIVLNKCSLVENSTPILPSSKSESNRVLIINALSGGKSILNNLSDARDTQTMLRLLQSNESTLDVLDAGTTMRFLTAYQAIGKNEIILTGSNRMQERPIGLLVEALNELGANISYMKNEGYPPLKISPFTYQKKNQITIKGDISSQFISALLLIASSLPQGLEILIDGELISKPYVDLTLANLASFGIQSTFEGQRIKIEHQQFLPTEFTIESDWSAASYWYSFFALSSCNQLHLKGLRKDSHQGDAAISEMMQHFGVATQYQDDGITLIKQKPTEGVFVADMLKTPDMAQTFAVLAAAKGVGAKMSGVQSLLIKETDRVAALKNELVKMGSKVQYDGQFLTVGPATDIPQNLSINTYEDHRMAMAFAPLSMITNLYFDDESVVAKSYPQFWSEVNKCVRFF